VACFAAVRLHHRLDGPTDAPVLVLAHSLGATHAMWEPQVDALARRFRVLRFDARGHGGSPAPPGPYTLDELGGDALELVNALGVERVRWCGLSLGAMLGMWVASEAPGRVEQLVLACTSAQIGPASMWTERARDARTLGMAALADAALERWLTPAFRSERPDVAGWVRAMFAGLDPEGYASCCEAVRDMELLQRLGRIRARTLVIAAGDDPAAPPAEHSEVIARAIPGARLTVLEGARHLANVERPEAFTAAVLDWLDRPGA